MAKTITVTGIGRATAAPDAVIITGEFSGTFLQYEDAVRASANAVTALRKVIGEAGFDMDDLKTTRISVDPVYRNVDNDVRFHGYRFVHGVSIQVDTADDGVGKILGAMVSCQGAPEFRMRHIVSDPSEAESEARKDAVRDAKRKAKELADAAGLRLGEMTSITYGCSEPAAMPMMRASIAVDMVPADIEFTDQVTIQWDLF